MDKKIEKATVIVANEVINYAEGGIVSKEFVHANAGSLTLFAFDEGQGLSEHSAPFDATVQVLDGEAEVKIDGVPHVVKAGEMIIMPANHPHALFAHKRFKMLLTSALNQLHGALCPSCCDTNQPITSLIGFTYCFIAPLVFSLRACRKGCWAGKMLCFSFIRFAVSSRFARLFP